jgi:hypothetical protein
MEQKIMKTLIAIMVAILAAAIVVACSQDDTVPGPVKSVVSITAVDTSQDVNFDGVDIRAEPDTQDSGQDSKTRSVAHTPGSISAVRRDTPDSEDSEGFIRDSWMGPDVTADVESDTTEDLQPETTTTKLDITQLIDTNNSGSQAKDTNGNQQDVSANQNEAMSPTDTLPDTSVQQEDTSSGLLDIFKSLPDTWQALDTWQPQDTWQQIVDIVNTTKDMTIAQTDLTSSTLDILKSSADTQFIPDIFKSTPDATQSAPDILKSTPDTQSIVDAQPAPKPDTQVDTPPVSPATPQIVKFVKGSDGNTTYSNTQFGYSAKFPSWLMNAEKKDGNLTLGGSSTTQANFTVDLEYIEKPGYVSNFNDWFAELYGKPDHKVSYGGKTLQFHSIDYGAGFNRYTYIPISTSGAVRVETSLSMPQAKYSKEFEDDVLKAMYTVTDTVQPLK